MCALWHWNSSWAQNINKIVVFLYKLHLPSSADHGSSSINPADAYLAQQGRKRKLILGDGNYFFTAVSRAVHGAQDAIQWSIKILYYLCKQTGMCSKCSLWRENLTTMPARCYKKVHREHRWHRVLQQATLRSLSIFVHLIEQVPLAFIQIPGPCHL